LLFDGLIRFYKVLNLQVYTRDIPIQIQQSKTMRRAKVCLM
jgi:hypothetical protein